LDIFFTTSARNVLKSDIQKSYGRAVTRVCNHRSAFKFKWRDNTTRIRTNLAAHCTAWHRSNGRLVAWILTYVPPKPVLDVQGFGSKTGSRQRGEKSIVSIPHELAGAGAEIWMGFGIYNNIAA
jgi:hypothetical protein